MAALTWNEFNSWCNNQNILTAAGMTGSLHPDYKLILYAQAVHETGNFNSHVWKTFGNAFGMKLSLSRKALWLPPPDGFTWKGTTYFAQTVSSWRLAIKQLVEKNGEAWRPYAYYKGETYLTLADRLAWDVYNNIVFQSMEQYVVEVAAKGYAEDKDYVSKWLRLVPKVHNEAFVGPPKPENKSGGGFVFALPLILWYLLTLK